MANNTYSLEAKDSSTYEDGYNIFLKRSNFRERILSSFQEIVSKRLQSSDSLKVLDVGCGDGEMTKRYLQCLKPKTKKIMLSLIEPALSTRKSAVDATKGESEVVYSGSILPSSGGFDLIIASYVFYHLQPSMLTD